MFNNYYKEFQTVGKRVSRYILSQHFFNVMSKSIFSFCMLMLFTTSLFAQKSKVEFPLDSVSVLQLMKDKKLLYRNMWISDEEIARTPSYQPKVEFMPEENCWKIISEKHSTTRRGKCRKTNGCTIFRTMTVRVDARNGKILSKRKTVKKTPNYE